MTEKIEAIARRPVVGHKRDGRNIYDPQARIDLHRELIDFRLNINGLTLLAPKVRSAIRWLTGS